MKLEKIFIATVAVALLLAVPIATALKDRTNLLKLERTTNVKLELKVESVQKQLDRKEKEIRQQLQQNQGLEKKNSDLQTQLQAKRDKQAAIALASKQTVVTPSVVSKPTGGSCEAYRPLVAQYNWDVHTAMAVMEAESTQFGIHCNPNAANWNDQHYVNGVLYCVGSFGLFQIACFDGQVYDPAKNIAIAYRKWQARGWQPWGAYTSGAYLRYY